MELDLQSLFGLLCIAVLIFWRTRNSPPPPPPFGLTYEGALLVSQDRRHLFVTPLFLSLTQEEQGKHAFFLSLAALLGEKVFNFGELLAHKVSATGFFGGGGGEKF